MSDELDDVITMFEQHKVNPNPIFKSVPHPDIVLNSLYELKDLAGNKDVKKNAVDQIATVINSPDNSTNNAMINALFYGPPGTGKSTTAVILSKIWYGLGLIKPAQGVIKTTYKEKMKGGIFDYYTSEGYSWLTFIGFLLVPVILLFREYLGTFNTIALIIILLAILLISQFYFDKYRRREHTTISRSTTINNNINMTSENLDINEILTVASPSDFIGKYSGWTEEKTQKILNENLGKVLFIDESYSFVSNDIGGDTFGKIALNMICSFLTEHPGEIIVIFAGYKDKIERNIFGTNEGLRRRFPFKFHCGGYDHDDLFKIFKLQCKRFGWEISEDDIKEINVLFEENYHLFTEQGGDCENLLTFSKMCRCRRAMKEGEKSNILEYNDILQGMAILKRNKIESDKINDNDINQNLYDLLSRRSLSR